VRIAIEIKKFGRPWLDEGINSSKLSATGVIDNAYVFPTSNVKETKLEEIFKQNYLKKKQVLSMLMLYSYL
jgi:hypothetical protein